MNPKEEVGTYVATRKNRSLEEWGFENPTDGGV